MLVRNMSKMHSIFEHAQKSERFLTSKEHDLLLNYLCSLLYFGFFPHDIVLPIAQEQLLNDRTWHGKYTMNISHPIPHDLMFHENFIRGINKIHGVRVAYVPLIGFDNKNKEVIKKTIFDLIAADYVPFLIQMAKRERGIDITL